MRKLPFWCQKVLPLVYDGALSYYEAISKVVDKLNELVNWSNTTNDTITAASQTANEAEDKAVEALNVAGVASEKAQQAIDSVPTKVSQLQNDSNFVNATQAADVAPVQSVNGETGNVDTLHYGVCETAADVANKTVSIPSVTSLFNGLRISVYFKYGLTVDTPYLKVNDLSNVMLLKGGRASLSKNTYHEGTVLDLVYIVSGWLIVGNTGAATTTFYGITKLTDSVSSSSSDLAASAKAVKTVKDAIPTKVSNLTNDSGFITSTVPFNVSFNTTDAFTTQVDALETPGSYSFSIPYNNLDMPLTNYGWCGFIQFTDTNYISVVAFKTGATTDIYRINKGGGTWGSWHKVALADDIPSVTNFVLSLNNTSAFTTQVDSAITANGVFSFLIESYGHQTATGMPTNANYYGMIFRGSATYITVMAFSVGSKNMWMLSKSAGTWGTWSQNT